MNGRRRWGFRARLAALIAGVFIAGGAVLLGVQYLLVQQLFTQGMQTVVTGCDSSDDASSDFACGVAVSAGEGGVRLDGGDSSALVIEQTMQLSEEVLSGLLLWSAVVLLVFAGLAVLAAWWLSKRSLGRIAQITQTTRAITRDDLHRRLDLPGPDDEIRELGDTIDGMLDRLDDAFERQDRFIAGASHELRTPLTTTRTLLEIPLAQGRVPAELEPAVRGALEANARSERLIAALLTLARSTQGGEHRQPEPFDLSALARSALDEHREEASARGVRIDLPHSPALAVVDQALAGIAIGNLVVNAIRHNVDGGRVRISARTADDAAHLVIENDGRLFTAAEAARLVEPFHRGAQTRLAGHGTGLGLTLAETIARALGGSLAVAPREAGGIAVRLRLPSAITPGRK